MENPNEKPPPPDFQLGYSIEGHLEIRYRTMGLGCLEGICFFFWTFMCVLFTYWALFAQEKIIIELLLFTVPFWLVDFLVLGYALWFFRSITIFSFHPDRLLVEKLLFGFHHRRPIFHHRRTILRQEIDMVRQVKYDGEEEDYWGLAIEGRKKARILFSKEYEKSAWLGPIVAGWAGVEYKPLKKE